MNQSPRECLPLDQVLKAVNGVETELIRFYERAAQQAADDEAQALFRELSVAKRQSARVVEQVCESAECGAALLENPTDADLHFLTALTQSAFYKQAGDIAELLHPKSSSTQLLENAMRLERDLSLFYLKFYAISCHGQRQVFSELLRRTQDNVSSLNNVRIRIKRGLL